MATAEQKMVIWHQKVNTQIYSVLWVTHEQAMLLPLIVANHRRRRREIVYYWRRRKKLLQKTMYRCFCDYHQQFLLNTIDWSASAQPKRLPGESVNSLIQSTKMPSRSEWMWMWAAKQSALNLLFSCCWISDFRINNFQGKLCFQIILHKNKKSNLQNDK